MSTHSMPASPPLAAAGARPRPMELLGLYLELSKARLALLVVLTTVAGFIVAPGPAEPLRLLLATVGTALSAFGANILNQVREVEPDRRMHRTRSRPLPSGRIDRRRAVLWGVTSAAAGVLLLTAGVNLLTAGLSLLVILLYVAVYTPMKRLTPLNTVVGAVCGAIPPMMGVTAASGELGATAWLLGAVLFAWQMPHFLALAWYHREDYARGGFRMLPQVDPRGALTGGATLLASLVLLPVCAALYRVGAGGPIFLAAGLGLSGGLAWASWRLLALRTAPAARRLFLASLVYLPLLLGVLVADPTGAAPTSASRTVADAAAATPRR